MALTPEQVEALQPIFTLTTQKTARKIRTLLEGERAEKPCSKNSTPAFPLSGAACPK